jgi:hypothetical protein
VLAMTRGPLSESERDELNRLRNQNAEPAVERDAFKRSAAVWVKEAMQREPRRADRRPGGVHRIPHVASCRALGVSRACFSKWRRGDGSPRRQRRKALAHHRLYVRQTKQTRGHRGSPLI